jgi:hypothetical protein
MAQSYFLGPSLFHVLEIRLFKDFRRAESIGIESGGAKREEKKGEMKKKERKYRSDEVMTSVLQ